MWSAITSVTDRQTDRRTDRRTDGRQATATPFHAIAWDGKNWLKFMCFCRIQRNFRSGESMQITQGTFKSAFFLQHSETFDVQHPFLPLAVAKLSTLKRVWFFGPPCTWPVARNVRRVVRFVGFVKTLVFVTLRPESGREKDGERSSVDRGQ